MGVREHLGAKRIRPEWRYKADGAIWQLYTGDRDLLVGEDRTIDSREVTFFCVERATGSVLWRDLALPERWWVGIETICHGVVLFHLYASPDLPGHRGLVGADMLSGSILWTLPGARFLECAVRGIRISADAGGGKDSDVLLDVRTGSHLSSEPQGNSLPLGGSDAGVGAGPVGLPRAVNAGTPEVRALEPLLRGSLPPEILQVPIQVLEAGSLLVILTHRPNHTHGMDNPGLHARVHLLRRADGRIMFEDTVLARTLADSGQHVFVQDGLLYYVQERRTLVAIALSES
jgi:hypothetical protein